MKTRTALSIVVAFALIVTAAGCQDGAKAIQRQQQYVLDVERPQSLPAVAEGADVLRVRRFTIATQFETYEMVYRRSDLVYESDFYNRWFAPPASLITDKTRQWISESGVFAHVLDSFSAADYNYILEGSVLALYGDYRQRENPSAIVHIQFTLIDEHRLRDSVVFQKKYRASAQIERPNASALVHGFNACLAEIFTSLETDLAALSDKQ